MTDDRAKLRLVRTGPILLVLGIVALAISLGVRTGSQPDARNRDAPAPDKTADAALRGRNADAVITEQRIELQGTLEVRVREAASGAPVPDAEVQVLIPVELESIDGKTRPEVELAAKQRTDMQGVILLDPVPESRAWRLVVNKDGFVTYDKTINDLSRIDGGLVVELRRALNDDEASVKIVVDGVPKELQPSTRLAVRDETMGRTTSVRPGDSVFIDADPAASGQRQLLIQLLLPGLAGPWEPHTVTRGETLRLRAEVEALTVTIVAATAQGRSVQDAHVAVAPAGVSAVLAGDVVVTARTDADGAAVLHLAKGGLARLTVEHTAVYFPESPITIDLSGSRTRFSVQGYERDNVRFLFGGHVPVPGTKVWIQWLSYSALSSSSQEQHTVFPLRKGGTAWLPRYARSLPTTLAVEGPTRAPYVSLPMLFGAYEVRVGSADAESSVVTFTIEPRMTSPMVNLAKTAEYRYRVRFSDAASRALGSPHLAVVVGHHAGWHERAAILKQFGPAWRMRKIASSRWTSDGSARRERGRSHRTLTRMLSEGRYRGIELAPDIAFVRRDGVVTIRSAIPPTRLTFLLPDGQVAAVPAPETRLGEPADVTLHTSSLASLACSVTDESGRPVPGYRVSMTSTEDLSRGIVELNANRVTDEQGVVYFFGLPGDRFLIFDANDTWRVTAEPKSVLRRTVRLKGGLVLREVEIPSRDTAKLLVHLEGPTHQGNVEFPRRK